MCNVNSAEGATVPPEPAATQVFEDHRELLMAVAYGYPIAQFVISPPPPAMVHRTY